MLHGPRPLSGRRRPQTAPHLRDLRGDAVSGRAAARHAAAAPADDLVRLGDGASARADRRGGRAHWLRGRQVPFVAALLYIVFTTTLLDFDALAANCELYMLLAADGVGAALSARLCAGADRRAARRRGAGRHRGPLQVSGRGAPPALCAVTWRSCIAVGRYACCRPGRRSASASRRRSSRRSGRVKQSGGARCGAVLVLVQRGVHPAGVPASRSSGPAWRGRVSYGVVPALFIWVLGLRAVVLAVAPPR